MVAKLLDFRSDTAAPATDAMMRALAAAPAGDDTLDEDPTVQRLEAVSAVLFGKEAGLFVISGSMANQIAVMALTQRGDEVIVGEETHIYNLEVGGLAALSGAQVRPLHSQNGRFSAADMRRAIRPRGIQSTVTSVLCLENTYDLNRGIPLPLGYHAEMADIAHGNGLTVYMDGARIFHAAVAFNMPLAELCRPVDCLQFCLSKALAVPAGSVLVGSKAFIERARWMRQRVGGGVRYIGNLAAAGIVALETMLPRLGEDHGNARLLAEGLAALDARLIDPAKVETNILRLEFDASDRQNADIAERLQLQGIKIKPIAGNAARMITHCGITREDVAVAVAAFGEALKR